MFCERGFSDFGNPRFNDPRSAFNDPRSAFNDPCSMFMDLRSGFNDSRSGFNNPHSGYSDPRWSFFNSRSHFNNPRMSFNDPRLSSRCHPYGFAPPSDNERYSERSFRGRDFPPGFSSQDFFQGRPSRRPFPESAQRSSGPTGCRNGDEPSAPASSHANRDSGADTAGPSKTQETAHNQEEGSPLPEANSQSRPDCQERRRMRSHGEEHTDERRETRDTNADVDEPSKSKDTPVEENQERRPLAEGRNLSRDGGSRPDLHGEERTTRCLFDDERFPRDFHRNERFQRDLHGDECFSRGLNGDECFSRGFHGDQRYSRGLIGDERSPVCFRGDQRPTFCFDRDELFHGRRVFSGINIGPFSRGFPVENRESFRLRFPPRPRSSEM